MLFDLIMRGPDSYWKKRYHAEEIKRRSAESDARFVRGLMEEQEDNLDRMTERCAKQAIAIEALNKEQEKLRSQLREAEARTESQGRELAALREALKAQQDAHHVMKTNSLLWESLKDKTINAPEGVLGNSPEAKRASLS